ncbi:putative polysaccharide biosynthesis protein [Alkaliphilus hydrothermalis]|uniref:Stage V sporulation protein B n=1 Tax=Alkaliphilus hydrothermalis TaxID=1482730 RepID=A0ABS2NT25_9FIRM|nr:polysaccharide biosynthesis protein [Alkaliphilus hydrothermalis]MBM7616061.1 stage V sporulation protein B [Alkaliphilus hydrothermalis]
MSNNKFLKGAFILAFAGLFAKFLGVFFKIPLQRLIHDEGMGLFGLPYPIYTVLLGVSLIGFPAAISKVISEKLAVNDHYGAKRVFKVSFFMLFTIGIFTSLFLYFTAPYIIQLLDWPQEAYHSIVGLAFAPFFVSVMSSFRGYFQGMQFMLPTALSQIAEQVGRVVIGVGLAYFVVDKGVGYAAGAASFGATAGGILGMLVMLIYYWRFNRGESGKIKAPLIEEKTWHIIKRLSWLALPITIGAVLSSIMGLIDSIIVHSKLINSGFTVEGATILYGRLTGKAVTLMNVPLTFSMAMAASLVPAISESFSGNRRVELQEKISAGIRTTIIIALPAAVGLSLLSQEIVHLLWGKAEAGGEILRFLAINVVFISLAQTLTSILQGMNRVFIPVRNLIVGVVVKMIVSNMLLVTYLNIIGTVIGTICGYIVIMFLNFYEVRKMVRFKVEIKEMVMIPIIAVIMMTMGVKLTFYYGQLLIGIEAISTLLAVGIGVICYFAVIFCMGGISFKDKKFIFF